MNLLTGKTKEYFEKWLQERNCNLYDMIRHRNIDAVVVSAYIIEWLDSVGIYINIVSDFELNFWCRILYESTVIVGADMKSRSEAIEDGIKKSNKIYNER